jgi:hypothetical protein
MSSERKIPRLPDRCDAGDFPLRDRYVEIVDAQRLVHASARPFGEHDRHRPRSTREPDEFLRFGRGILELTGGAVLLGLQDDETPILAAKQIDRSGVVEALFEEHPPRRFDRRYAPSRAYCTHHRSNHSRQVIGRRVAVAHEEEVDVRGRGCRT